MTDITINFTAVLGATVVGFIVGWLWYGPLFGKAWMRLSGHTKESMKSMKLSPVQSMALGFVFTLVTAYVLAHFIGVWGVVDTAGAWSLAFWLWLGFAMPIVFGTFLWEGKPFKLFLLNAAYYLVIIFVMAAAIVMWS